MLRGTESSDDIKHVAIRVNFTASFRTDEGQTYHANLDSAPTQWRTTDGRITILT